MTAFLYTNVSIKNRFAVFLWPPLSPDFSPIQHISVFCHTATRTLKIAVELHVRLEQRVVLIWCFFLIFLVLVIDVRDDAICCLTHLLCRPGQRLHDRLLLIPPSHIPTQKYHKEWILLSLKHSGQPGRGWNFTPTVLWFCTKRRSWLCFLHFAWQPSSVRAAKWDVSPSQKVSSVAWLVRRRKSKKEWRRQRKRRRGRSKRGWPTKKRLGGEESMTEEDE